MGFYSLGTSCVYELAFGHSLHFQLELNEKSFQHFLLLQLGLNGKSFPAVLPQRLLGGLISLENRSLQSHMGNGTRIQASIKYYLKRDPEHIHSGYQGHVTAQQEHLERTEMEFSGLAHSCNFSSSEHTISSAV